jgi:chromosome segregation ATPase
VRLLASLILDFSLRVMASAAPAKRCASVRAMADDLSGDDDGLRRRLARSGEDALGRLAQDLLENPLVHGAIARAFEAREKAAQAQEVAMGALNIPSAADIERLTRRVRSVSQRLEAIEDGVDRLDQRLAALSAGQGLDGRLAAIDEQLQGLAREVSAIAERLPARATRSDASRSAATRSAAPRSATPRAAAARPRRKKATGE